MCDHASTKRHPVIASFPAGNLRPIIILALRRQVYHNRELCQW